ncbi:hypothetical protein [Zobellella sp. DQSA1]|uniref:hypothetical protein n=1 Tax=Zobellella sp. DQSA1 TaxID=3342386 RepID=UPI0035BEEE64
MNTDRPHPPNDPVAAATHEEPRAYYARLAARSPYFDAALACWVAASVPAVGEVLSHPALLVRPETEPVPGPLQDTPAGALFAALVRMTDGPAHGPLKAAIRTALDSIDEQDIRRNTRAVAALLIPATAWSGAAVTRFNYALPGLVLAQGFGIPRDHWPALADEVLALVRCIAPGGSEEEIAAGARAAARLEQRVRERLMKPGPLLGRLCAEFERAGLADSLLVANAVGLLFQACEGCAGLLGQALILAGKKAGWDGARLVEAVLDDMPPIQNTRRFVARDARVAGCPLQRGDTVLAVLAAEGRNLAFGQGPHACPGARWARVIAVSGGDYLQQSGLDPRMLARYRWRRSLNVRVPEFF